MAKQKLKILLFHGFMACEHMQRHWLKHLKALGYEDVHLLGYLQSAKEVAQSISLTDQQKLVLIGYSQGGFQAVKVARALNELNQQVDLLVTIAAGGRGRTMPSQWRFNPRLIPKNVLKSLNFFSLADPLGTDHHYKKNLIQAENPDQVIENIIFDYNTQVGHIELSRCYPLANIHILVRNLLISRIEQELSLLNDSSQST